MNFPHLPATLISKCRILIKHHVKTYRSNLAADVWDSETKLLIAVHTDLFALWGGAVSCFKIRIMIWIVSLLILFGGFFSLYALIGLIPAITIERFFAHEEKEMYLTLAAIVLALEMLATDFAGLADRYPEGHNEAILAFSGLNSDEKTRLLEKYFPGRDEVAPEALEAFAVVD